MLPCDFSYTSKRSACTSNESVKRSRNPGNVTLHNYVGVFFSLSHSEQIDKERERRTKQKRNHARIEYSLIFFFTHIITHATMSIIQGLYFKS